MSFTRRERDGGRRRALPRAPRGLFERDPGLTAWAVLTLALGLVLTAEETYGQPSVPERPAICWRTVGSEVLGSSARAPAPSKRAEDSADWLELLIGADRGGLLVWGDGAGADASGVYSAFQVRGDEPHVFLRGAAEDPVVWINATARGDGVGRMTIRTRRSGTGSCRSGNVGSADFLEIDAVGVNGASSCQRWPLPAAAETGSVTLGSVFADEPGTLCFPTAVPQLVGEHLVEAERLIFEARLQLGQVEVRPSRSPAGVVLEQSPDDVVLEQSPDATTEAAALPPETTIDLVVGRFTDAPDLVGEIVERAGLLLGPLDLLLEARSGDRAPDPETIARYRVASQRPAAGESVPVGSVIEVQALVAVPSFLGMPLTDVLRLSADSGLSVDLPADDLAGSGAGSAPAEVFTVDRQSPPPGELMAFGDMVELELAVAVPELRGLSVTEASNRARARGLRPDPNFERALRESRADIPTSVASQRPAAGSRASPGDPVSVDIAVPVPELRGRRVEEALDQLEARGLAPEPGSASLELWLQPGVANRISGQRPEPGTWVVPGTAVTIEVDVRVPALARKTRRAAVTSLEATRLRLGEVGTWPATSRLGTVVTQRPLANTWAAAGSAVGVTVAGSLPPIEPWKLRLRELFLVLALLGAWKWVRAPRGKLPEGLEIHGVLDHGRQSFERDSGEPADLNVNFSLRIHADAGRQSLVENGPTKSDQEVATDA